MIYLTEQKNDAEAVKWFRKAADQDVVADTMTEFLRIGVRLTELIAWGRSLFLVFGDSARLDDLRGFTKLSEYTHG
jgi:hypothetical protein